MVTMKRNISISPAEKQHQGLLSFNVSAWQEQRVATWLVKLNVYKACRDISYSGFIASVSVLTFTKRVW